MNVFELIKQLVDDTNKQSLPAFLPELVVCGTIVAMLLVRIFRGGERVNAAWIALPGTVLALFLARPWLLVNPVVTDLPSQEIFGGMLRFDSLTIYFRSVLLVFGVLFLFFTMLSGIPDKEDSPDFYTLFLGATLGMMLMSSANHMLMVFLAVEMASVPSYALAGILKGRRLSSEAALKYSVYGAGTAGVMLYGISLLSGALGSAHIPTMALQLVNMPTELLQNRTTVLLMGGLFVMVGIAFKLSAVPFHFWCPDVFEGAAAEVNAFLSVSSKAAALALLLRLGLGFTHVPHQASQPSAQNPVPANGEVRLVSRTVEESAEPDGEQPAPHGKNRSGTDSAKQSGKRSVDHNADHRAGATSAAPSSAAWTAPRRFIAGLIGFLAAITCTFGNLAAYAQTNIKRLLAYSTIAHAGYMMMPVAAAVALAGTDHALAKEAVAGLVLYVGIYLFTNLGAFAVVAFLRNAMRSEEIKDYAGLLRSCPGVAICFSLILISLIGLPPLAGFPAKFFALGPLFNAGKVQPGLMVLLIIGAVNTAISLFYYLRVIKLMLIDPEPEQRPPLSLPMISPPGVFLFAVTFPILLLGVYPEPLNQIALAAAAQLLG